MNDRPACYDLSGATLQLYFFRKAQAERERDARKRVRAERADSLRESCRDHAAESRQKLIRSASLLLLALVALVSPPVVSADFCFDYRGPDWKTWEQICTTSAETVWTAMVQDRTNMGTTAWGWFRTRESCLASLAAAIKKRPGVLINPSCQASSAEGLRFVK